MHRSHEGHTIKPATRGQRIANRSRTGLREHRMAAPGAPAPRWSRRRPSGKAHPRPAAESQAPSATAPAAPVAGRHGVRISAFRTYIHRHTDVKSWPYGRARQHASAVFPLKLRVTFDMVFHHTRQQCTQDMHAMEEVERNSSRRQEPVSLAQRHAIRRHADMPTPYSFKSSSWSLPGYDVHSNMYNHARLGGLRMGQQQAPAAGQLA